MRSANKATQSRRRFLNIDMLLRISTALHERGKRRAVMLEQFPHIARRNAVARRDRLGRKILAAELLQNVGPDRAQARGFAAAQAGKLGILAAGAYRERRKIHEGGVCFARL